jgi:hypothetical protein
MVKAADVKLEPCPFCKGEVELWKYSEVIKCRFICKKCKVEVEFPRGLDSKDCIKKWNRRATQKGITVDGGNDILDSPSVEEELLSETICMDEGPNQFNTVKYRPTCVHGCTDCIWDPAYIYATYPNWYKKLYGEAKPAEVACENCADGERYDDEDK